MFIIGESRKNRIEKEEKKKVREANSRNEIRENFFQLEERNDAELVLLTRKLQLQIKNQNSSGS